MKVRLQKLLSQWGIASRRQAEKLIAAGRVTVNGEVAHLGQGADPIVDMIQVDGKFLGQDARPSSCYLLLNKPVGVVSTCHDPQGRRTVLDLLPRPLREGQGIHPVGRLDIDSTGALLLTNDGQLTHQLTHPRHHIPKVYRVRVQGRPSLAQLNQWRQGLWLEERQTLPAQILVLCSMQQHTCLEITLREGRNRQIRRVAEMLGHPVLSLHRCSIGTVGLDGLPSGEHRYLTCQEIQSLNSPVSMGV
ncbi:MAG: pseudouridine synthase [Cyanobacteria bacterium P01_G01_bin.38]